MQTLASFLPATSAKNFNDSEPASDAGLPDEHTAQFDDVMSRALSPQSTPREQMTNQAAQNRPARVSPRAAENKNPVAAPADDETPPAKSISFKAEKSAPTDAEKKVSDKDDAKSKNNSASAPTDANVTADNLQEVPIQVLAPTLSAYLLKSSPAAAAKIISVAETTISTNAQNADAVSGVEKKTGSQPGDAKLDSLLKPDAPDAKSVSANEVDAAKKNPAAVKDLGLTPEKNLAATVLDKTSVVAADKIAAADVIPAKTDAAEPAAENAIPLGLSANLDVHAPMKAHGTAVAKQDVPMKKTENTNKVAGQGEKVLPGNVVSAARGNNLPARAVSLPSVSARAVATESNIIPMSSVAARSADAASVADSIPVSNLADIRARALDRAHDMMAVQAVRLVDAKLDSLSVVIKPGAGMQLSLQLKQNGDGIEAQAVLQHGDFEDLNQHWPELQQRLEQRGIKLAPLTSDENAMSFANPNGNQNGRQPPTEETALMASAFAEFSLAGAMTESPAPATSTLAALARGGWQSWA